MLRRNNTREVRIGNISIGNGNPIAVQSMTKTFTTDVEATLSQISKLHYSGCDIIRIAVPTKKDTKSLAKIVRQVEKPIVADIHFSADRAIESIEAGVAKIRINPGNVKKHEDLLRILDCAKANSVAIRIGINEASIRNLKQETPPEMRVALMMEEMKGYVNLFEDNNFTNIVLSAKSVDVCRTIQINEAFAKSFDYPIHIGLTHAGLPEDAMVPSAVAIGSLLANGIGDTVRVSLAGDPVAEIHAAQQILASLGLYEPNKPKIVVCPTCGRCMIDVISLAEKVKLATESIKKNLKIAVMGCVVNGPGEAADADVAICAGSGKGFVYSKGERVASVPEEDLIEALLDEIKSFNLPDKKTN